MSNDYIYSILISGILSISVYSFHKVYKNKNDIKNKIDVYITKKKSEKIIKDFFKQQKIKFPDATLDELILAFENSDKNTLDEYAQSKNRNAESYRQIYKKFI